MKCTVISKISFQACFAALANTNVKEKINFKGRETSLVEDTQPRCRLLGGGDNPKERELLPHEIYSSVIGNFFLENISTLIEKGDIEQFFKEQIAQIATKYQLEFCSQHIANLFNAISKGQSAAVIRHRLVSLISRAQGTDAQRINAANSLAFTLLFSTNRASLDEAMTNMGKAMQHYHSCKKANREFSVTKLLGNSNVKYADSESIIFALLCRAVRVFGNAAQVFEGRVLDNNTPEQPPSAPRPSEADPSLDSDLQSILPTISRETIPKVAADIETLNSLVTKKIECDKTLMQEKSELEEELIAERLRNRHMTCRMQYKKKTRHHPY